MPSTLPNSHLLPFPLPSATLPRSFIGFLKLTHRGVRGSRFVLVPQLTPSSTLLMWRGTECHRRTQWETPDAPINHDLRWQLVNEQQHTKVGAFSTLGTNTVRVDLATSTKQLREYVHTAATTYGTLIAREMVLPSSNCDVARRCASSTIVRQHDKNKVCVPSEGAQAEAHAEAPLSPTDIVGTQ